MYLTPLYSKSVTSVKWRHFCSLSSDGVDILMSFVWMIHALLSRSYMDNSIMAFGILVDSTSDTKISCFRDCLGR